MSGRNDAAVRAAAGKQELIRLFAALAPAGDDHGRTSLMLVLDPRG